MWWQSGLTTRPAALAPGAGIFVGVITDSLSFTSRFGLGQLFTKLAETAKGPFECSEDNQRAGRESFTLDLRARHAF